MLNIKLLASSAALFLALSFVLCVAFGLVAPERFHMLTLLEAVLPGFEWISPAALFLGLVPATYEVRIRERGRLAVRRQITIHGPVLADLEIAEFAGSGGGGGGK